MLPLQGLEQWGPKALNGKQRFVAHCSFVLQGERKGRSPESAASSTAASATPGTLPVQSQAP